MLSVHLTMQFVWKFIYFNTSWPYEGTRSLSTITGEFLCWWMLFEDRGGIHIMLKSEGENNMRGNNSIAEGNDLW